MPTKIDWADETINPLGWGCYGPGGTADHPKRCFYCYAHRQAKRKMRDCPECQIFRPHFHPEQLEKLKHWKKSRRIFVQSMGDMFGPWVPQEWIQSIFKACYKAPQHHYLFLTKQPKGIGPQLDVFPAPLHELQNWRFGVTITEQKDKRRMFHLPALFHDFISCEPLLGPIDFDECLPDWLIIGAMTGPGAAKHQPKREWIDSLVEQARAANIPIFMKQSLEDIYPGKLIQERP